MRFSMTKGLLLASALIVHPAVAFAQPPAGEEKMAEPPADAPSPDDPSLQTVSDSDAKASDADAKMALLQAQIEGLQAQLDEVKKVQTKNAPVWKGAPQFSDDTGFSWKVRGRFMLDSSYMSTPERLNPRNFGFNTRVRRIRLGVEGTLPADFAYKAEFDFANAAVGFGDVTLAWNPKKGPVTFTIGNFESLDGMEQITSSRWSSFIERAQINDAFGNTRRLGMTVGYKSKDNLFRIDAGLFTAHSIDASLDNKGWIGALRATYAPYVGPGFVHIGFNYQHREFQENNGATALTAGAGSPSVGQLAQYRARPFLQTTGTRFVDTQAFAAKGDDIFGVELYGVFKSLHLGGEAQVAKVNGYSAGDRFGATSVNQFATTSQVVPVGGDATFWGGHFEVGYFLTGETRGYKNGLWDRTKVGSGAFQILGRVDYLDLSDKNLQNGCTNNFVTGVCTPLTAASGLAKGGHQLGILAGLTWIPTDYVRFLVNYIHTNVTGGTSAATVVPVSTDTINKRTYSTDAIAMRAQFDF
jgi:phosphate-selective porin OprO/OprP